MQFSMILFFLIFLQENDEEDSYEEEDDDDDDDDDVQVTIDEISTTGAYGYCFCFPFV